MWHIEKNVYKNVKEKWIILPIDVALRLSRDISLVGIGISLISIDTRLSLNQLANQLVIEALFHDWKVITYVETLDDYSSRWAAFCS